MTATKADVPPFRILDFHPGEFALLAGGTIFALTVTFPLVIGMGNHSKRTSEAVGAALSDAAFVDAARQAGYRVERAKNRTESHVLARCARADASGPLPCDPLPGGDRFLAPDGQEVAVRMQP